MNRRNFLSTIAKTLGAFILAPVIKVLEPVARTMYDPSLIMKFEMGSFSGARLIMTGGMQGGKTAGHAFAITQIMDNGWQVIHPDPTHDLIYGDYEEEEDVS